MFKKLDASRFFIAVVSLVFSVLMVGCGMGDNSPLAGPGATHQVTGVAAVGAPVFGSVTLKDSASPSQELTTATASDGSFAFDVSKLKAPFLIKTVSAGVSLYSLAESDVGVTNVNPFTTLVVNAAASGANLDSTYTQLTPTDLSAMVANLANAELGVRTALKPMLDLHSVTGNLLHTEYIANHDGADGLLDKIKVVVINGAVTISNKANATVIYTDAASNLAKGLGAIANANIPPYSPPSVGATLYRSNCASCHGDLYASTLIGRSSLSKILNAIASNFGGMSAMAVLTAPELQAISDAIPTQSSQPQSNTPVDGATLYANKCAICHGALASSKKAGATFVRIQDAISKNLGGMGQFSTLTSADVQGLVTALNGTNVTPTTPAVLDGAALYAANCSGCHGVLANSSKKGLTFARFTGAVTNNTVTGMGYLSSLTLSEVQAIITALTPATPVTPVTPLTPAELYAANCAACHGSLAISAKAGRTAAQITTAISLNSGGVMGSLSPLTATQISDIASALATVVVTPPVVPLTGAQLYANNCSGCHGALATSTKGGKAAATITAAITAIPQMNYLSTLLPADITAIATALATVVPPTTPAGLYATNCSGCHGALATSTKGGATAAKITAMIAINRGGMGTLSTLTPQNITDIASALAAIPAPACGSCHAVALASLATGKHATHTTKPKGAILTLFKGTTSCGMCHGVNYTTSSNDPVTHNDGTVNIDNANSYTINWKPPVAPAKGTCGPSCHNPAGAVRSW